MADLFEKPAIDEKAMLAKVNAARRAQADTQARYDKLHQAGNELLRAMRDDSGSCIICRAIEGQKHAEGCAAWPFIETRVDLYD